MQVTKKNLSETKVQLTLVADAEQLQAVKKVALEHVAKDLKLPGFRQGKIPLNLVEKNANPAALQTEFLDHIMNDMYVKALQDENLRPVAQPEVKVLKFVPFEAVEIEATVEVVGDIKLPDYKKVSLAKPAVKVTTKDVDEVIDQLKKREAEKKDVERAAKDGDQTYIDFKGVDAETKEAIAGADGKDYPLILGSKTFIPGFEEEVVGVKPGESKTFVITFPADYGAKELQNKKVEFTITVNKVQEVVEPKLDDVLAAKVGPFKNVDELKADIRKQLETEKAYQNDRAYTDELLLKITRDSTVAIPEALITEQLDRLVSDQKQNLMYRGQTWQEFLESQDFTEETYRESLKEDAELRVKAGLVLGEIAEAEKVTVTPEELDIRMQLLKGQYPDKQMQAELDKPESRREIASRLISEKTIDKIVGYATKSTKAAK
ncbi:MAG TPA: trigger factor [Candidatus Saccharimonadales bacterium]|nr:trigger factor [Candidatus Saccharimonadales bacterium]